MENGHTDLAIKGVLKGWNGFTKKYWSVPEESKGWIQCQPKTLNGATPLITLAGNPKGKTQPDGMYVAFVGGRCVDVICIEGCTSKQNFGDKRSRYVPSVSSHVLKVQQKWLDEKIPYKRGEKQRRVLIQEKRLGELLFPVRHLRVLFAVTEKMYSHDFIRHLVPHAHEYVCKISSLGSQTSDPFLKFIKGMSQGSHFYTKS